MLVEVCKTSRQALSGRNVKLFSPNYSMFRPDGAYRDGFISFSTNMTSLWDFTKIIFNAVLKRLLNIAYHKLAVFVYLQIP